MTGNSPSNQQCSGVVEKDGAKFCKHGHAFTYACLGSAYPKGYPSPVCISEEHLFDEASKTVRIVQWRGR